MYEDPVIAVVAEANYQQGFIAEDQCRYKDALALYVRASNLTPCNEVYSDKIKKLKKLTGE